MYLDAKIGFFQSMTTKIPYSIFGAIFIFILSLLASCVSDPKGPDVSKVPIDLKILRFEEDLFRLDTNDMEGGLDALNQKYPDFLPFFLREIAHNQDDPDETPIEAAKGFITADPVLKLRDSVQQAFPDFSREEKSLEKLMKHHRYYLPDAPSIKVVTAVTEFISDAYMVNDSVLLLGLDMFLGADFVGYNPEVFPAYLTRQFSPEYLPVKAAMAISNQTLGPPPAERVLDHMIHNGKRLYIMSSLLPETPDSLVMGYTAEDMAGCYANEQNVWARLLDMEVLYEQLGPKNMKIVMPSPNATNVYTEAPGEIGNWIGLRIVEAYMKRNPETSMDDLIQLRDSQKLLEAAKYKPARARK